MNEREAAEKLCRLAAASRTVTQRSRTRCSVISGDSQIEFMSRKMTQAGCDVTTRAGRFSLLWKTNENEINRSADFYNFVFSISYTLTFLLTWTLLCVKQEWRLRKCARSSCEAKALTSDKTCKAKENEDLTCPWTPASWRLFVKKADAYVTV